MKIELIGGYKKDELETMSNKDIACLILEESKRKLNTADLFKKIMKLLDLRCIKEME